MLRDLWSFQGLSTGQLSREFEYVTDSTKTAIATTGGRNNGWCLRHTNSTGGAGAPGAGGFYGNATRNFASRNTWIVGFRLLSDALPATYYNGFINFMDYGVTQIILACGPSGNLGLYRNTTQLATSTAVLAAGRAYYIECKVIIGSSGYAEARVNGSVWVSYSGNTQSTANASVNGIAVANLANVNYGYTYINDMYLADDQAGIVTDYLGPIVCDATVCSADGYHTAWTPSTGSNRYSLIDEKPANDDTDYITGTVTQKMTVKTISLGYTSHGIKGVKLTGVAKTATTEGGIVWLKRLARKSSSDNESAIIVPFNGFPLIGSYGHFNHSMETDPFTGTPFTQADVESNIEWGYEAVRS